ncbi:Sulfotransferase domain-containing protein [Desulfacinum hydrothermale DSM 13146]|uniref:Sulfotransferase domain-containing protein n=1 Tax=Desulfacinum hydrothermale DSM 13146 TaxID=1121390 RepID=A0A1W1XSG1_9BACT|nr:sulfotransferase domain-containing protein [Desulfacinum hydrothermale]SMC26491.1 Sulfotransferase domain-containing protein [Desulfacinum hydrothermale DSM 13146]
MTNPNFFIIGAPKCGTTSLSAWLAEHPNIYMSPMKEPQFFNSDLQISIVPNRYAYERLFRGVKAKHAAVGEASVWYLASQVAVPRIEQELPGSRYIVMIRNPVDAAYSLHEQQLVTGNEHIKDFAAAWNLSEEREVGKFVTRRCREPRLLNYKNVCLFGRQLARLMDTVCKQRVLVLLLDDVKENPRREYMKVLDFLGVEDDGRQDFPAMNTAKELRWPILYYAVRDLGHFLGIKRWLAVPELWRLVNIIIGYNNRFRPRELMSIDLREELTEYFREDIYLLQKLLERDLSPWLDVA